MWYRRHRNGDDEYYYYYLLLLLPLVWVSVGAHSTCCATVCIKSLGALGNI